MKKINNKGFSLLEIILAIAIASILFIAIYTVFNYTSNNYRNAKAKMTAQEEAEYASNFIYEVLVEAQQAKFTKANIGPNLGGGRYETLFVATAAYEKDSDTNKNVAVSKRHVFIYDDTNKSLYYASSIDNNEITDDYIEALAKTVNDDTKLLAENVSIFSVDKIGKILEGEPIKYTIAVTDGSSAFEVKNEACSRNSIVKTEEPTEQPSESPTSTP